MSRKKTFCNSCEKTSYDSYRCKRSSNCKGFLCKSCWASAKCCGGKLETAIEEDNDATDSTCTLVLPENDKQTCKSIMDVVQYEERVEEVSEVVLPDNDRQTCNSIIDVVHDEDTEVTDSTCNVVLPENDKQTCNSIIDVVHDEELEEDNDATDSSCNVVLPENDKQTCNSIIDVVHDEELEEDNEVTDSTCNVVLPENDKQTSNSIIDVVHEEDTEVTDSTCNVVLPENDRQTCNSIIDVVHEEGTEVTDSTCNVVLPENDKQTCNSIIDVVHEEDTEVTDNTSNVVLPENDKQTCNSIIDVDYDERVEEVNDATDSTCVVSTFFDLKDPNLVERAINAKNVEYKLTEVIESSKILNSVMKVSSLDVWKGFTWHLLLSQDKKTGAKTNICFGDVYSFETTPDGVVASTLLFGGITFNQAKQVAVAHIFQVKCVTVENTFEVISSKQLSLKELNELEGITAPKVFKNKDVQTRLQICLMVYFDNVFSVGIENLLRNRKFSLNEDDHHSAVPRRYSSRHKNNQHTKDLIKQYETVATEQENPNLTNETKNKRNVASAGKRTVPKSTTTSNVVPKKIPQIARPKIPILFPSTSNIVNSMYRPISTTNSTSKVSKPVLSNHAQAQSINMAINEQVLTAIETKFDDLRANIQRMISTSTNSTSTQADRLKSEKDAYIEKLNLDLTIETYNDNRDRQKRESELKYKLDQKEKEDASQRVIQERDIEERKRKIDMDNYEEMKKQEQYQKKARFAFEMKQKEMELEESIKNADHKRKTLDDNINHGFQVKLIQTTSSANNCAGILNRSCIEMQELEN